MAMESWEEKIWPKKFNFGGKLGIDLLGEEDGVYMGEWLENMLMFIKLILIFFYFNIPYLKKGIF
jgi:hypothetical protein